MELFGIPTGPLIVSVIRLLVPLSIFRWQLGGAIASVIADALDVVFVGAIGKGNYPDYSRIDKLLDTYFLSIMLFKSLKWEPLAKATSICLFVYRFIGFVLFELTGLRWLLLVFPNLFEFFYLFWAARNHYFPKYELTKKRLAVILLLLLIPKLAQEYVLHYLKFGPWNWINTHFFGWKA